MSQENAIKILSKSRSARSRTLSRKNGAFRIVDAITVPTEQADSLKARK